MGAALGGGAGGGGGGRRRRRRKAPMADINMTPFIDVMLCLLIIFMVAAPLLTAGVPLDLPKSDAGALNQDKDPLTVSVKKNGDVFVQETKVAVEDVVPKLKAVSQTGYDERVFVRGDGAGSWTNMARVMGSMSAAGFHKLAIVTQPDDN